MTIIEKVKRFLMSSSAGCLGAILGLWHGLFVLPAMPDPAVTVEWVFLVSIVLLSLPICLSVLCHTALTSGCKARAGWFANGPGVFVGAYISGYYFIPVWDWLPESMHESWGTQMILAEVFLLLVFCQFVWSHTFGALGGRGDPRA